MDFNQLTAFVTVAQLQSFSKAAEQLHLTQSAISKRIATLETTLDVMLFERFGQRIQLTEAGKTLLVDAKAILDKVGEMQRHSDMAKQVISGKLRIATSHHIGLYRLPAILQDFVKHYPKVQLDMHFTDSEVAYEEVSQGLFDFAIATLPHSPTPMIKTVPLWTDELVVMFAKNHAMYKENKLTATILAQYAAILPEKETFTRRIIDQVFNAHGISYRLAFTTNYLETIKGMVEVGLGWSVLPKIMLSEKLACLPLPDRPVSRQLGMMLHKNKVITPALSALIDLLHQHKNLP